MNLDSTNDLESTGSDDHMCVSCILKRLKEVEATLDRAVAKAKRGKPMVPMMLTAHSLMQGLPQRVEALIHAVLKGLEQKMEDEEEDDDDTMPF